MDMNKPLYKKIYDSIVEKINTGEYTDGYKLPTEQELADMYNVSRITSKKAMDLLKQDGYIRRYQGKGSFINIKKDTGLVYLNQKPEIKSQRLIGFLMPDFSASYGMEVLEGVEEGASNENNLMIMKRTFGDQKKESEMIDELINAGVEGIIIMPVHGEHYSSDIMKLMIEKFPLVLIDRQLKGLPTTFVGTNNLKATQTAANYLLDLGHKNICFLSPPVEGTSVMEERLSGFKISLLKRGLRVNEDLILTELISSVPGNYNAKNVETDIQKIIDMLKKNPEATCLFALEYNIALLARKAVQRLGLKVPDDISIICFDGPSGVYEEDYFTRIKQNEMRMGELAVKLLNEQFKDNYNYKTELLDVELIEGRSTRKL